MRPNDLHALTRAPVSKRGLTMTLVFLVMSSFPFTNYFSNSCFFFFLFFSYFCDVLSQQNVSFTHLNFLSYPSISSLSPQRHSVPTQVFKSLSRANFFYHSSKPFFSRTSRSTRRPTTGCVGTSTHASMATLTTACGPWRWPSRRWAINCIRKTATEIRVSQ